MADKSGQKFELPKKSSLVAEMFTTQEQRDDDKREKVQEIPLSELDTFPDHPFQVKMDEAMQAMADSVKAVGIQEILLETIESEESTPSHVQAMKMRKFSEEGRLNEDVILSIMQEEKPNQVEQFKMPKEKISKYFAPGTPAEKIEDTIIKALELWRQRERNRNDAR